MLYCSVPDLLELSKLRILGYYAAINKKNEPGFYLDIGEGGYVTQSSNLEGMGAGPQCWRI